MASCCIIIHTLMLPFRTPLESDLERPLHHWDGSDVGRLTCGPKLLGWVGSGLRWAQCTYI